MTNVSKPKMFQIWSKKIMLGLLKPGLHRDRRTIREKLVKYVDERGMSRPMLNFGAVHCLVSDYATFAG